jgi:hypothetical protein
MYVGKSIPKNTHIKHVLCMPIIGENKKVQAVYMVVNPSSRSSHLNKLISNTVTGLEDTDGFDSSDEDILKTLCDFTSSVLHRVSLMQQSLSLSRKTDSLKSKIEKFVVMIDSVNAEMDPSKVVNKCTFHMNIFTFIPH